MDITNVSTRVRGTATPSHFLGRSRSTYAARYRPTASMTPTTYPVPRRPAA